MSLFFILLSILSFQTIADTSVKTNPKFQILESHDRIERLQPSQVVNAMEIRPGMDILDIGAGSGLFSFLFADALDGTGKVYATDVNAKMVKLIQQRVEDRGQGNVIPVLVNGDGIDPFYKQHEFDVIFMASVYYHLVHHVEYFKGLYPSLKEGGRLYILQPKNDSDFSPSMFSDVDAIAKKFRELGDTFPVYQRMGGDVQGFLKDTRQKKIPAMIHVRITEDFNKMLYDRTLFYDLLDYYYTNEGIMPHVAVNNMDNYKASLINWLAVQLDEDGVFDDKTGDLSGLDRKRLHKLNRLMLVGIFQLRLSTPDPRGYYLEEKNSITRKLEKAGYHFVRSHDFLDYDLFLEFRK